MVLYDDGVVDAPLLDPVVPVVPVAVAPTPPTPTPTPPPPVPVPFPTQPGPNGTPLVTSQQDRNRVNAWSKQGQCMVETW